MLPVVTAPNAIVYDLDKFKIKAMAQEGLALNVIIAFVVVIVSYLTLS